MWIIISSILTFILAFAAAVIFSKWRVELRFCKGDFTVKLANFTVFSSKNKQKTKHKTKPEQKKSFSELTGAFGESKKLYKNEKDEIIGILKEISSAFECEVLNFVVDFGFGNAAVTGIANGIIWAGVTAVVTLLKRFIDLDKKVNLAVSPNYTEACFSIDASVVFYTKPIWLIRIFRRIKALADRNENNISNLKQLAK